MKCFKVRTIIFSDDISIIRDAINFKKELIVGKIYYKQILRNTNKTMNGMIFSKFVSQYPTFPKKKPGEVALGNEKTVF